MLDTIDHLASIGTALLAAWAYGQYRWEKGRTRRALEKYLREEKLMKVDNGRRTITHLVAELGVPADKILEAAFASPRIRRKAAIDKETNYAKEILLEYKD